MKVSKIFLLISLFLVLLTSFLSISYPSHRLINSFEDCIKEFEILNEKIDKLQLGLKKAEYTIEDLELEIQRLKLERTSTYKSFNKER